MSKSAITGVAALGLMVVFLCVFGSAAIPEEKVILEIWDTWTYYGMSAAGPAIDKIHAEYQKAHPNVRLDRSVFPGGHPMREVVDLALVSEEAPDVFYVHPSGSAITIGAKADWYLDLTSYADKFGWWDRLPEWAILRNTYKGRLRAYPWEQDFEYIYYSPRIFKELGVTEPKSWGEWINICEKAKKAGYIPISYGNKCLWQAPNNWTDLAALTGGRQLILDVLQGRAKWDNLAFRDALERLTDMAQRGFFTPGFNGVEYQDSLVEFYAGKSAMKWDGSWVIQDVIASMKAADRDVFYIPQIYPDKPQATLKGEGSAYFVWAKTKIPDVAAEYIDSITSEQNLKTWIEDGYVIPIRKGAFDYGAFHLDPMIVKAFSTGQSMVEYCGDAFHITAPPRVTYVLYHQLGAVLTGKQSIDDFLKQVDETMEIAISKNEHWQP